MLWDHPAEKGTRKLCAPESTNKWMEGKRSRTNGWSFPSDGSPRRLLLPEALLGPWAGLGWASLNP